MKKIVVIGAGYVGLVTGACLAQKNNSVIIVERELEKITSLLNGKIPFYEPGLDKLVLNALNNRNLSFVNSIESALQENPEFIFSCVGTPSLPDGSADLSAVWQAAHEVGTHLVSYALVINKSTVPVSTAHKMQEIIQTELTNRNCSISFDIASNPEFLREGEAVNDFFNPDRIIVGVANERAQLALKELYQAFTLHNNNFVPMSIESAELSKYAANAMLATRISFMNQMALLADKVGADIEDIKKGIALDNRIGSSFLNAGIGYGGSCFPKDVRALVHMGNEHNTPMTLAREVDHANENQRTNFVDRILHFYHNNILNKRIGIWGLAFKPETDDIRHAPSIDVINKLLNKGAKIIAYDPVANTNIKAHFKDSITLAKTADDVIKNVDSLIILTEWKEFLDYDFEKFTILKDNVIFDGRNCYAPERLTQYGISYITIGRNILNTKQTTQHHEHTALHKGIISFA